jgi:hypothetical protein
MGWVVSVTLQRCFTPGKGLPVSIVQEAGWTPEPVWAQRLEEKSFRLCRGSNLNRPVIQSVARLSYPDSLYYYKAVYIIVLVLPLGICKLLSCPKFVFSIYSKAYFYLLDLPFYLYHLEKLKSHKAFLFHCLWICTFRCQALVFFLLILLLKEYNITCCPSGFWSVSVS